MRIKILAALSALAIALGMVAFASMPSSAHQGNIVASAVCNTTTGNYDVTYTLSWSNVPDGVVAALSTRTGTTQFVNGWGYSTFNDWTSRGNSTGNLGSIHWTEQLPGNTVGNGPWVYAYTKWSNGYDGSLKHDTRAEGLRGNCTIPTPLDASATATPTPATCDAPGGVTFGIKNATWENSTDITDGSRRAFANKGHLFSGGFTSIDVGYVIQPQKSGVECQKLVTPVQPAVANSYESCNTNDGTTTVVLGTITFGAGDWTWTDNHNKVVSGAQKFAKGTYTFTATAKPGFKFDNQGTTTKKFTVVVGFDSSNGSCLIKVTPVTPKVTATDVCGTANDTLTIDSTQAHVAYAISWNADKTEATVTASVTDSTKYAFAPGAVTVWTFQFTNKPCEVVVSTPPNATAQQCLAGQAPGQFTMNTGGINVVLNANLQYTITGSGSTVYGPTVVTAAFTALAPGDYTVGVVALNGFVLTPGATSQWPVTVTAELCSLTVPDPLVNPETCSVFDEGAKIPGNIWVDLGGNLANELEYQIKGNGVDFVATQETNTLTPGDYTVTATAKPGFQLSGQTEWKLTIKPSGTCSLVTHPLISTTASSKNMTCATSGSFTLANTTGVVWYTEVNGVKTLTKAGTYKVTSASTVKVHADVVDSTYGWEDNAQRDWTFNFTATVDCLPTLAFTGSAGGSSGLMLSGVLLLLGGTAIALERRFRTSAK